MTNLDLKFSAHTDFDQAQQFGDRILEQFSRGDVPGPSQKRLKEYRLTVNQ